MHPGLYNKIQVSFFVSLAILGILVQVKTGKSNTMQKKKATISKLISNGQG
jgi:predicted DNA-binding ArsR family transcriptional regulator